MQTNEITDAANWDDLVATHGGHPLQLWGWGDVKASHNWTATRLAVTNAKGQVIGGAQVLERAIPIIGRTLAYVPRGPFCSDNNRNDVLKALPQWLKANSRAIGVLLEPDQESAELPETWKHTSQNILLARTLRLDLTKTLDELQSAMTKKTRQYIRKSERDITVENVTTNEQLDECMKLYHETADRAGFALHGDAYYHDLFAKLGDGNRIYLARHDGQAVAFVWLAASKSVAFELYGGNNDLGQQIRANYALKWHAITTCQADGIEIYDMNGLYNDGISTFKMSFASHENLLIGTYYRALSPLYKIWQSRCNGNRRKRSRN